MEDAQLQRCFSYLSSFILEPHTEATAIPGNERVSVTLSREAGARGHTIANRLAALLQKENRDALHPWLVFDQELVNEVIREYKLPLNAASYMREESPVGEWKGLVGEILGLHPSTADLLEKTHATIRRLARVGHMILLGRGSNFVTRTQPNMVHVRLVGSLERRARHLEKQFGLGPEAALHAARHTDKARAAYVNRNFSADIHDPHAYHLVLNTDLIPDDSAAQMLAAAVRDKQKALQARATHPPMAVLV